MPYDPYDPQSSDFEMQPPSNKRSHHHHHRNRHNEDIAPFPTTYAGTVQKGGREAKLVRENSGKSSSSETGSYTYGKKLKGEGRSARSAHQHQREYYESQHGQGSSGRARKPSNATYISHGDVYTQVPMAESYNPQTQVQTNPSNKRSGTPVMRGGPSVVAANAPPPPPPPPNYNQYAQYQPVPQYHVGLYDHPR